MTENQQSSNIDLISETVQNFLNYGSSEELMGYAVQQIRELTGTEFVVIYTDVNGSMIPEVSTGNYSIEELPDIHKDTKLRQICGNREAQVIETDRFPESPVTVFPLSSSRCMATEKIEKDSERFSEFDIAASALSMALNRLDQSQKAEKSDERISEYSGVISHDLRNPLNLAKGYLDLAKETGEEEDFEEVKKALNRLEQIIEHILYLMRKPEGLNREVLSLQTVFEEVWESLDNNQAEAKSDATYKVEDMDIKADKTALKNLMEKLLSNSLKHNNGDIEIRSGPIDRGFYFEDDGIGVKKNMREKAFDYGFSTAEGDEGFGLAVVRRIAEEHGWDYEAKASNEGGARFEFKFN